MGEQQTVASGAVRLRPGSVEAHAAAALGGTGLRATTEVWPSPELPRPYRWRRPRVLRGLRMPGDRGERVKDGLWGALMAPGWPYRKVAAFGDWFHDLLTGELGDRPFSGGWGSEAGRLAAALRPRSSTGVVCVLQLTDEELRLSYVQRGRRSNLLGAVEAGWAVPRHRVTSLSFPSARQARAYDVGFADGSWARVCYEEAHPSFHSHIPRPNGTFARPSAEEDDALWSGRNSQEREIEQRAAEVLAPEERLLASQFLGPGHRLRRRRGGRRPWVFDGLRLPRDRRVGIERKVLSALLWWLILAYPFALLLDLLLDWYPRGKGPALRGGRNSLAGRFAAALHPRARTTGVAYAVQVTDRHLRVTYVQRSRDGRQLGAVQPGFTADRSQVAWLRHRPDIDRRAHELGFTDGSYARIALRPPVRRHFTAVFPPGPPR